jgi:hypothetical protein
MLSLSGIPRTALPDARQGMERRPAAGGNAEQSACRLSEESGKHFALLLMLSR